MGTFFALKPFYILYASAKDLAMCCCKKHLHARWAPNALVTLMKKQEITLPEVSTYLEFFNSICTDCNDGEHTYLTCECTPNKKQMCKLPLKIFFPPRF